MARHASVLWALGLLLGCNGTETGNPLDDPGESAGGNCEVVSSTKLDLGEASTLGFSANEVLAYAGGARTEALSWQALRFGSYGPESGSQTLALGVTARGAKLVQYANKGGIEIEQGCGAQLEIEADVTLQSSAGALNESVRSLLVAKRVEVASLWARLDPVKLGGTLTVTPPSGWTTASINLGVQFTRHGVSGSLTPSFEQRTKDSVGMSAGSGPLATFGLPPCDYGVSVPLDAGASTLALLAQHGTATLGTARATLVFEPGETACQFFGDAFSPEPVPALVIPGTLVVKTADGAIDGRWSVRVRSKPNADGQLTGPVEVQLSDEAPAGSSLAERYGFTRIDTRGYDSSSATVMLNVSASGWSGSVVVYGFVHAQCPPPVSGGNGSPGCAGAARSELARFEAHSP
jgi:hypothetical protein